ncbi:site-specific DNA-methyltransferase [Roseobacter sp. HKCCA0434]|uniref:DNA-methyltransferase n=1 Tax=Roseobacter sp. HKCCA0434 TaxID=3079297 RepID=UPI002905B99E|nr:site-specific DNA-methyltransferase [Roseobacter sp. HKCCA0434]
MSNPIRSIVIEDDCLAAMSLIPDGSVNMVLCDLPYGTTQNKWDSLIPLDNLWREYRRILAPKGAVVLTGQGSFTARLILSNEDWFRYKLTWVKSKATNFLNAKKQPLRKHEDICVFYPQQPHYSPQRTEGLPYDKGVRKAQLTGSYGDFDPVQVKSEGGRYPTDVIYHKTAESEGQVYHSTQKPVGLGRYLVRTYTRPGDVVLDNACGSGSFLLSAVQEGRHAIGIELNRDVSAFRKEQINLVDVMQERLQRVGCEPTVLTRPKTGKVFNGLLRPASDCEENTLVA